MSSKNETGFWIGEKGRQKWSETGPEMVVKQVLESIQSRIGFTFKHGTQAFPLAIHSGDYTFRPDFIVSMPRTLTNGQLEKVIEVDGVYHFTEWQRKKGRWRDSLMLKQGYDIVHVDALLCQKAYLSYLKAKMEKALMTGSPVEFLYG